MRINDVLMQQDAEIQYYIPLSSNEICFESLELSILVKWGNHFLLSSFILLFIE
jgi:hypothetical protein